MGCTQTKKIKNIPDEYKSQVIYPVDPPPIYNNNSVNLQPPIYNNPKYENIDKIILDLRKAGMEDFDLIVAIDLTKSNEWTGKETFNNKCLHKLLENNLNMYEESILSVTSILEKFDTDSKIPVLGFGDNYSTNQKVLILNENANGTEEVLSNYRKCIKNDNIYLSGPTSFIPIFKYAINHTCTMKKYTVLLIIGDGEVSDLKANSDFINNYLCNYPISVIMIGVGDGRNDYSEKKWEEMERLDNDFNTKRDCFQFVDYNKVYSTNKLIELKRKELEINVFEELPKQYIESKKLFNNCLEENKLRCDIVKLF